jgi:hypothetical protein
MAVYHRVLVSAVSAGVSGAQAWVPVDVHGSPFRPVSWGVQVIGPMGADYTVESTQQPILAEASVARAQTMPHPDASGAAVNTDGNYVAPIRAVRLWVTPATSGSNAIIFTVTQGDP